MRFGPPSRVSTSRPASASSAATVLPAMPEPTTRTSTGSCLWTLQASGPGFSFDEEIITRCEVD